MTTRVLIVDDHGSWRRFISTALQPDSRLQVIDEASDGFEAVQKAEALRPDLIVLDIGLPTLNGIEAARRIRTVSPHSNILFFSEQRAPDIAEAALATGASGYVVKSDADADLLPAIDAIIQGASFISPRFAGHAFASGGVVGAWSGTYRHEVLFTSDEASLLDRYVVFASAALTTGSAAILVTRRAYGDALYQHFKADNLDIDRAIEDGRYVWLDAADVLSTILLDGWPNEQRFWPAITPILEAAARASTCTPARVVGCGECAAQLWKQGGAAAAIRLEQLWDTLARKYGVAVLCGYALPSADSGDQQTLEQIAAQHSSVISG
jgi:DNA-binding NarL/FixJ family response regulator